MNLSVNGSNQVVDAPGDTKLLWVIREHLRLTGTKFGCGLGLCGACTVHMNGEAVRSCQIELSDAEGTQITTIEGLGANGHHPVQKGLGRNRSTTVWILSVWSNDECCSFFKF